MHRVCVHVAIVQAEHEEFIEREHAGHLAQAGRRIHGPQRRELPRPTADASAIYRRNAHVPRIGVPAGRTYNPLPMFPYCSRDWIGNLRTALGFSNQKVTTHECATPAFMRPELFGVSISLNIKRLPEMPRASGMPEALG